MNVIFFSNW